MKLLIKKKRKLKINKSAIQDAYAYISLAPTSVNYTNLEKGFSNLGVPIEKSVSDSGIVAYRVEVKHLPKLPVRESGANAACHKYALPIKHPDYPSGYINLWKGMATLPIYKNGWSLLKGPKRVKLVLSKG